MKTKHENLKLFLFIAVFFLASCGTGLKNETQKELGESLFTCAQKNDVKGVISLYPTKADYEALLAKSTTPEDKKAEAKQELDQQVAETEGKVKEAMLRIDEFVKTNNIKWSDCKSSGVEESTETRDGLEIGDVTVNFSYNNIAYQLRVSNIIKSNRGWLLMSLPSISLKE